MADYQLFAELLGLLHVQVAGYQILNSERIEVRSESRLNAAVCPIGPTQEQRLVDSKAVGE